MPDTLGDVKPMGLSGALPQLDGVPWLLYSGGVLVGLPLTQRLRPPNLHDQRSSLKGFWHARNVASLHDGAPYCQ